jgi:hypothetical protein
MIVALALATAASSDACALLRGEEIAAVQGEAPTEMKSSVHAEGPLQVSDCVFVLPTFGKSIALQLTRGEEARRRWKEVFHSRHAARREERESKEGAPEAVHGLGDEAFWVARGPSSALYVLRRKVFLRISLGGADPRDTKIAQATALLRKALRRL